MRAAIVAFLIPLTLLTSGQAWACGTGSVLFEDSLQSPDASWGFDATDDTRTLGPAGASWEMDPDFSWSPLNQTSLYEDFEVCAKVSLDYPKKSNGYVGVTFWAVDPKNNYSLDVFPKDHSFAVYRVQNGKTLKPVPYKSSKAINGERKAVNEISVSVKGKHAVVSVNGTAVAEFNGIPPDGGGLVGLDMGTDKQDSAPSTATFTDFQVRDLAQ